MLLRTFAELDAAKCVPTVGLHLVGRQETNSCWLVWRAQRCIDLVGELTLRGDSNDFVVSLKNEVEALTSGGGDVAHIQIEQALFVGFSNATNFNATIGTEAVARFHLDTLSHSHYGHTRAARVHEARC